MKWKVIRILLLCWLIPLVFLLGVMGLYVGTNHSGMTALNYQRQLEFNSQICAERLNRAVALSRQASYERTVLQTRAQYETGKLTYDAAQKSYVDYLTSRYLQSKEIADVILWFDDGEELQSASIYSERNNGNYQQIRKYWDEDHKAIEELSASLDTAIGFLVKENNIYLVRNMLDSHYERQAVLVFCLNSEYCFNSVLHYPMQDGVAVWINQEAPILSGKEERDRWDICLEKLGEKNYRWMEGQLCVEADQSGDGYRLKLVMMIQKSVSMFPFYGYQYVMGGMLLSLFLMMYWILRVFRREVTRPVEALNEAVQQIEQGHLGYHLEKELPNLEFSYLSEAVNHMSDQIRQQFNRIYEEEIALREARIMALQSHINPHFLNNTMEIINWEALLEGNEKVSRMISALSQLMDAAMDRGKRPEVSLKEEMNYVNAYLYIMKERLGEKLTIKIDIPESYYRCQVPRLILQPVIENAIEHGVIPNGKGIVTIQSRHNEKYLYLEILNNGGLNQGDRERIQRLLDPEYNTSKEPAGNLGIANVNQRLRILFGEPCGLHMEQEKEGIVTARLIIPWNEQ